MRHPTPAPPAEVGTLDGIAYSLWLPERPPAGGLVILHGAGSRKENHHDMARAARAAGLAAVCPDLRGHGASAGSLDDRVLDDVAAIAGLLPPGPLALRGSSMGGYLAMSAAERLRADAVVAICPASADHLRRGLRAGRFEFRADVAALDAFLAAHDLATVVARSPVPLMLLHAEGDRQVPADDSRALHARAVTPLKKLIVLPGGHHRSVQHDAEMQGEALRFIAKAFARAPARRH